MGYDSKRTSLVRRGVVGLALLGLFGAGIAVAATATVGLGPQGPQPATVTVNWGDTVTFRNDDSKAHGVTIPRDGATSPLLGPGATWARVFDGHAGNYGYRQTEGGRNWAGVVVVQLNGTVTMTASPPVVVFGQRVTFKGKAAPGLSVHLEHLLAPQVGQWTEVASVDAGADGNWEISLVPEFGTRFRATAAARQLRSSPVPVGVQPALTVVRPKGTFRDKQIGTVRARIVPANAASSADLERYDRSRLRWVREDRRRVGPGGVVSFRWKAVKGRSQLRVVVHRFALKPGFDPGVSKPVVVRAS
jgi:plastocyanin